MRLLRETEKLLKPLRFTQMPFELGAIDRGSTLVCAPGDRRMEWMSACCGDHVMRAGVHYAEFTITQRTGTPELGVVDADFDPTTYDRAYNAGTMFWAAENAAGDFDEPPHYTPSPGADMVPDMYEDGDVVGLLLDLSAGSLVVYLNGQRKGVKVASGIEGPVKWAADISTPDEELVEEGYEYLAVGDSSSSVRIESRPVPTPPSAEVLAAEAALVATGSDSD